MLDACHEQRRPPGRDVPPLHDPALGRVGRRVGRTRDRRPVRRGSASAPQRTSATSSASHCTINEPNVVALMGFYLGVFPPGTRDEAAMGKATEHLIRAHRLAYDAIKAGPGDFPVGLTLSMPDFAAEPGGDATDGAGPCRMEDVCLDAAAATTTSACRRTRALRLGPDGLLGPAEGVPALQMGYEYWPQALEATIRHAIEVAGRPSTSPRTGSAPPTTTSASSTSPRRSRRRPLPRRRPRRARLLLLVAARQLRVGARLPPDVRPRRRRPRDAGSHGQAERPLARRDRRANRFDA